MTVSFCVMDYVYAYMCKPKIENLPKESAIKNAVIFLQ